jgi:glutamyl-tRNA reductase
MKYDPNKPYSDWAEQVRMYEYGRALQKIAIGNDPNIVLEEMSVRIMNKLTHPLLNIIGQPNSNYDPVESRKNYEKNYLNKFGKVADHVVSGS